MNSAHFDIALAEIIEQPREDVFTHPYLTTTKFIFADDKGAPLSTSPDGLMQGIEFEDFDDVIKTAINMPIKMKFTGAGAGNHLGSYVIGHITNMEKAQAEDGSNQLIADAVLYAEEFPEEISFLKQAHAEKRAPGISYEIIYEDSVIKNGVQWLKKMFTTAATFVRSPGYGGRTALLALASASNDEELVTVMKDYIAQAEGSSGNGNPNDEGGINVTEEEVTKLKEETATYKAEAETRSAEVSRLSEELTTAQAENVTLKETIQTLESDKRLEGRVRRLAEAGFPLEAEAEAADKTKNFVLSLTDDAFDVYLESISKIKATVAHASAGAGVAFASGRPAGIPRPEIVDELSDLPTFRFR